MATPYGASGNGLGVLKPSANPFTTAVSSVQAGNNPSGPYAPAVYDAASNPNSTYLNGTGINTAGASGSAAASTAAARGDYQTALGSTNSSINDAIGTAGAGYNSSILDYLDSQKAAQSTIDSKRVQNELARQSGMQDILDMVGNGVKSGGVILANDNAGSSSAGEALARAYGVQGRQQASKVGNQFAQGESDINTQQDNLTTANATELRHANEDKTTAINSIVNSARSQLAALNASAASASLPDRVDIEGRIAQIKQQALDALTAYDAQLSSGGATPQSADQVRASANGLLTAGTAPESAFNYTTDIPTQLQDTGQFASSLPIFVNPNRRNNQ